MTAESMQPVAQEQAGDTSSYAAFLASKRVQATPSGFDAPLEIINPQLFDWQREIVRWALRRGKAALFLDCGMGKTPLQLAWAAQVHRHTGGNVLILAPLGVTRQTRQEGAKFGVPVQQCRSQADVVRGVNITNYELLSHFDTSAFAGVVLDESGILRNFMGKTKQALLAAFARTPYRLCCTATPAPNDYMELGNHAEFLGVMPSSEMLMRWFLNDTMQNGHYRLKGHAERDFWDWVASWAVSARKPSDLGYSDTGFTLPPLTIRQEVVEIDLTIDAADGQLFRTPQMNATSMHAEMRRTTAARAARIADIVNGPDGAHDAWTVWVNTDYEADALVKVLPDAVEVRGSESVDAKERKLAAFVDGAARVLITKSRIAGYGLNMQHCHRTAFMGLSYSGDSFYQAIRRHYRFRQEHAVEAVVVTAETEGAVVAAVERKLAQYQQMGDAMVAASRKRIERADLRLATYAPQTRMSLPSWLRSYTREAVSA